MKEPRTARPSLAMLRTAARWAALMAPAVLLLAAHLHAQSESLWEREPYRIALVVTSDGSPGLGADFAAQLKQGLLTQIETRIGAAWQIHHEETAGPREVDQKTFADLQRWCARGPGKLRAADLSQPTWPWDKVLFVHVNRPQTSARSGFAAPQANGEYRIEARDYDVRTQMLGAVVSQDCGQRPMLDTAAFETMLAAFAPLAEVDSVQGQDVTLRVKAAAIPLRDKQLALVQAGDLFQPIIRFNYRDGSLRRLQSLDWTYLQVEQTDTDSVACQLYTGLRSPLSGRRRGLVEQLAVLVRPPQGETQLQLVSRTDADEPLPGYAVYVQQPGQVATTRVGVTNQQGVVTVPAGEGPLQILLIKNGDEILARLPIAAGLSPSLTAAVPDDRLRLYAESVITGLQEQVIDVLSRRRVLLTQAENKLDAADREQAAKLVHELQLLKTAEAFHSELNQFERKIFTNDPRMKQRIEKLFTDTRRVVNLHLDPKPVQELANRLNSGNP